MRERGVVWLVVAGLGAFALALGIRAYLMDGTRRWFANDLPAPEIVRAWTEPERDARLHALSRWNDMTAAQWRAFVQHQIAPLALGDNFTFLEIGVGVGAFAREVLRLHPNATGLGIDPEPHALAIAAEVLDPRRFRLALGDMRGALPIITTPLPQFFDVVLFPGSLCYLWRLDQVKDALVEASQHLHPHNGSLCASMLPTLTSDMGSCTVRIPKSFWSSPTLTDRCGLRRVVQIENMNDWHLPHGLGRYSVCLRA